MKPQRRKEIIVGIFVIVAIAIVMWLIVQMGERFFVPQYKITAYFEDAGGLTPGVTVTYAGVQIGSVTGLRLLKPDEVERLGKRGTLVEIVLKVDKTFSIPVDTRLILSRTALLGEQQLMFEATPSDQFLPNDDTAVVWRTVLLPTPGEEVSIVVDELRGSFSELIANINEIIGDEQFKRELKETTTNIAALSRKSDELFDNVNEMVQQVQTLVDSTGKLVDNGRLESIMRGSDEILTAINKSIDAEQISRLLDNLNLSNEALQKLAGRIDTMIEEQEGLLGKLLGDAELSRRAESTLDELREAAAGLRETLPQASAAAEQLRRLSSYLQQYPSALIFGPPKNAPAPYRPPAIGE